MAHTYDDLQRRLNAQLNAGQDDERSESEGTDVLLQVTLPVVLVLALLVVTEVQSLRQELDETRAASEQLEQALAAAQATNERLGEELSAAQRSLELERSDDRGKTLRDQRELMFITVREKLLREATNEVARGERERLDLDAYSVTAPNSEDVRGGLIQDRFKQISRQLAAIFNDPRQQSAFAEQVRTAVTELFNQKVDEYFAANRLLDEPGLRRRTKHFEPQDEARFLRELKAHVDSIQRDAVNVQLRVVLGLLRSEELWETSGQSSSIWIEMMSRKDATDSRIDEYQVQDMRDRFDNFDIHFIMDTISQSGVSLLAETRKIAEAL